LAVQAPCVPLVHDVFFVQAIEVPFLVQPSFDDLSFLGQAFDNLEFAIVEVAFLVHPFDNLAFLGQAFDEAFDILAFPVQAFDDLAFLGQALNDLVLDVQIQVGVVFFDQAIVEFAFLVYLYVASLVQATVVGLALLVQVIGDLAQASDDLEFQAF